VTISLRLSRMDHPSSALGGPGRCVLNCRFLSGGIIVCGHCGKPISGSPRRERLIYKCTSNDKYGVGTCGSYAVREDQLLPFLLEVLSEEIENLHTLALQSPEKLLNPFDTRFERKEEIEKALDEAQVAILLISADFLASDFITKEELQPLLTAAEEKGLVILPVILSFSLFEETKSISVFQAVNNPKKPLDMLSKSKRERQLVEIARRVDEILKSHRASQAPEQPPQPTTPLPDPLPEPPAVPISLMAHIKAQAEPADVSEPSSDLPAEPSTAEEEPPIERTSASGIDPDKVLEILRSREHDSFYADPHIPADKLRNARNAAQLPETEDVLGLFDLIVMGSAEDCLIFGTNAVYHHWPMTDNLVLPYSEFSG